MFDVTKEWFVAGVISERVSNFMISGQIDPKLAKSLEQFRIVAIQ